MTHSLTEVQSGSASDFSSTTLFGNTSDDIAIRPGSATRDVFETSVDGLAVQWGKWTSAAGSPSYWQNVSGTESGTLSSFVMVSAPTTDTATLNKLQGQVTYTSSGSSIADKNTGSSSIHDISSSLTVDVANATVTNGTLNVCIGASGCDSVSDIWEKWATTFSGSLANGKFTSTLSGSIVVGSGETAGLTGGLNVFAVGSVRNIEGTVAGNFTGTSGEGFVLGFRVNEVDVSTNSIIGASLLKAPTPITQSEIDALTYRGLAIVGPNSGASNLGISVGAAGNLVDRQLANKEVLLYSQSPGFVLNNGGLSAVSGTLINGVGTFDITWGRWTGISGEELKYQTSLSNSALFNKLQGQVIVATGAPSPSAALIGSKYFESTSSNSNFITAGDEAATSIKGQFNIDFGNGALTNGKMEVITNTYHWTTDTFTGTLANGTLPATSVTGDLTIGASPTEYAFTGSVAGHFVGSLARGFLAAFDFKKDAASTHSFGAVLFDAVTPLVPVLSSAEFTAFNSSTRYGFVLGEELEEDGLLNVFGKVTQYAVVSDEAGYDAAQVGATERLISSDPSDLLAVDETPSVVVERKGATLQGFVAGVNEANVNWGKWTSSDARIYSVFSDNSQYETLDQAMINVNFVPTTAAQFTTIGNVTRTYAGADTALFGKISHSLDASYGTVHEMKSVFDVDFNTGALTKGLLNLCLYEICSDSGATEWEFAYTGSFNNGILTNVTTQKATRDNTVVSVTGKIVGGFTGSGAQTFVGGYNYVEDGNAGHYLRGSFLLTPSTYLTAVELDDFTVSKYGMLTSSGLDTNGVFGGRSKQNGNSNNYLFADNQLSSGWNADANFHLDVPTSIFRKGNAEVVTENVASLTGLLTWGKWASNSGAPIRRVTLNSTTGNLEQDAYWFIATPSAPSILAGKYASYSNVLAVQGGGNEGAISLADVTDYGFTLDLSNGAISSGYLEIDTNNDYSWKVDFTGQALNKSGSGLGAYAVLNVTTGTVSGNAGNFTFNGSLGGMFINGGNQVVTAFAFNNSDEDYVGEKQHISGTLVAGKESLIVDWGDWDTSVGDNWAGQLLTDTQTLFSSLQLTPDLVINRMTGSYNYNNSTGSGQGFGGAAGSFNNVTAEMKVNFGDGSSSGSIYDGHVTVDVGDTILQRWHSHFEGSISNGNVTLNPTANQFTIDTDVLNTSILPVINTGTASFAGAFTGATGEGFVGAFEMLDGLNSANFVRGTFQLDKGNEITTD